MYHTIVKGLGRANFERVNTKQFDLILQGCAANIKHRFGGNHALGGERNDVDALRRWFARLAIVAPELKLTVVDTWVEGWPWNTHLIIRWTASMRFPSGEPYNNHGVHVVQLRWGKCVAIDANEDSQLVDRYLSAMAAAGCKKAAVPAITS